VSKSNRAFEATFYYITSKERQLTLFFFFFFGGGGYCSRCSEIGLVFAPAVDPGCMIDFRDLIFGESVEGISLESELCDVLKLNKHQCANSKWFQFMF